MVLAVALRDGDRSVKCLYRADDVPRTLYNQAYHFPRSHLVKVCGTAFAYRVLLFTAPLPLWGLGNVLHFTGNFSISPLSSLADARLFTS